MSLSVALFIAVNKSLDPLQSKQKGEDIGKEQRLDFRADKKSQKQKELDFRHGKYRYRAPQPRTVYDPKHECGMSPNFTSFFQQSHAVRSFRNEDKNIYGIFFLPFYQQPTTSQKNFTYVELGAFNGLRESNTRFFDVCLEWNGLLIEASPMKYPKLYRLVHTPIA